MKIETAKDTAGETHVQRITGLLGSLKLAFFLLLAQVIVSVALLALAVSVGEQGWESVSNVFKAVVIINLAVPFLLAVYTLVAWIKVARNETLAIPLGTSTDKHSIAFGLLGAVLFLISFIGGLVNVIKGDDSTKKFGYGFMVMGCMSGAMMMNASGRMTKKPAASDEEGGLPAPPTADDGKFFFGGDMANAAPMAFMPALPAMQAQQPPFVNTVYAPVTMQQQPVQGGFYPVQQQQPFFGQQAQMQQSTFQPSFCPQPVPNNPLLRPIPF